MDVLPTMRPLRARLLMDGSIEAEVSIPGVEQPVKLSVGRSERRMFLGGVDRQEIVQPHCVLEYGGPTFDTNGWRDHERLHLDDLRDEGEVRSKGWG